MNSMPFRQLKSFLKILIGVQYQNYIRSSRTIGQMPAGLCGIFRIFEEKSKIHCFFVDEFAFSLICTIPDVLFS